MTTRGQKIKEAFRAKYGVDHPSQLPWVKEKKAQRRKDGAYDGVVDKVKATKLERYGDANFCNVEKVKKTKKEKYGDENFNNRDKMLKTNQERYGMNVSPNTLTSTKKRSSEGTIGTKSDKFKEFLDANGVENASQIESVRNKKALKSIDSAYVELTNGDRLNGLVVPLFSREEYVGTEYKNRYKFKCVKCNTEFEDHLYSGHIPRCLKCYPHDTRTSTGQLEIVDFLKSLGVDDVEVNNRTVLDGLELDIYSPSKGIAVEYNGVFWHTELGGNKDRLYHLNKTKICAAKGVELIHILDQEWIEKRPIVESILRSRLGVTKKLFARNLTIRDVSTIDKDKFLRDNHLQGQDKSSIRLGLYNGDTLVSLMSFCKSRYALECEYELSRFCTLRDHQVVGGASKLFSHFIRTHSTKSVVSYADKSKFSGKLYEALKMTRKDDSPPAYHYVKQGQIVGNRIQFQKHRLKDVLDVFDPTLSEWENMKLNGYDRIWDCGNLKFVWSAS